MKDSGLPYEMITSMRGACLLRLNSEDSDEYFDLIQRNRDHPTRNGDYREFIAKSRDQISADLAADRRGYVTTSCRALIDAAVEYLGATEIWAGITHRNKASIAVAKGLGFQLARDQPGHLSFVLRV